MILTGYKGLPDSNTVVTIKIITDEPTLEDALHFDRYSQQLADIIVNSTPRFTIGMFGGWGTGKTTLMRMVEKETHRQKPQRCLGSMV